MSLNLKNELSGLRCALDALVSLNVFQQAMDSQSEEIRLVFGTIEQRMRNVEHEADELDVAMSARDSTIRALGEKLSVLRMKHAKPFIVSAKQDQKRDPTKDENVTPQSQSQKSTPKSWRSSFSRPRARTLSRWKSLFRAGEEKEWDRENTQEHMKEMAEQIARLSLQPMGLSEAEMQDQIADIAATRLYGSKAMNLIKTARAKGVEDSKIRAFLKRKGLPETTINRHFNQCSADRIEVQKKSMPEIPSFQSLDGSDSECSESQVQYAFESKNSMKFEEIPPVPCTPPLTNALPASSPRAGL